MGTAGGLGEVQPDPPVVCKLKVAGVPAWGGRGDFSIFVVQPGYVGGGLLSHRPRAGVGIVPSGHPGAAAVHPAGTGVGWCDGRLPRSFLGTNGTVAQDGGGASVSQPTERKDNPGKGFVLGTVGGAAGVLAMQ